MRVWDGGMDGWMGAWMVGWMGTRSAISNRYLFPCQTMLHKVMGAGSLVVTVIIAFNTVGSLNSGILAGSRFVWSA